MIDVATFRGEKVAVMGLARSGLVAAQALQRGGARVMAWDDAAGKRDAAAAAGVPLVHLAARDLPRLPALILSPGIPHTHPKPHPRAPRPRPPRPATIRDH